MDGGENLLEAMLEATREMGTRLTLRLEEVERYGSRLGGKIDQLILRLTARNIKDLLSGKKWPDVLRDRIPGLVEIELNDEVMERINGVKESFLRIDHSLRRVKYWKGRYRFRASTYTDL